MEQIADGVIDSVGAIKKEKFMKIIKRILVVAALIVAAVLISYLIYTGGRVNA